MKRVPSSASRNKYPALRIIVAPCDEIVCTTVSLMQCNVLPVGQWHVGYKRAFDLFPKGLQKRIVTERKKRLDQQQREAITKATAEHAKLSADLNKQVSTASLDLGQLYSLHASLYN